MALATIYSAGRRWRLTLGIALCIGGAGLAVEGPQSSETLKVYREARQKTEAEPKDATAAWQFARACFDLGEFSTNSTERAQIAEQGIAACRSVLARDTNSAPGHYYLGLNLGQLARTRGLGALKLVNEMEREFLASRGLDPHFDNGGPDRSLGLLYHDAPSIASVGSRTKARRHMQLAVEMAPLYPDNRLNLIEAEVKWGDRKGGRRELKELQDRWEAARKEFSGPGWAASWSDWESRLDALKQNLEKPAPVIESPRQK